MERADDGTNQKTTERNGTDGNSHRTHGNGREQAGKSRESRRTTEKVLENTVHDNVVLCFCKSHLVQHIQFNCNLISKYN